MKFVVSDGTVYRFVSLSDFGRCKVWGVHPGSGQLRNFWEEDVKFLPPEDEIIHPGDTKQEVNNAGATNVQSPERVRPGTRKKA